MKPIAKKSGNAIATAVATLIFTAAVPVGAVHADAKGKCIGALMPAGARATAARRERMRRGDPEFLQGQGLARVDEGGVRARSPAPSSWPSNKKPR